MDLVVVEEQVIHQQIKLAHQEILHRHHHHKDLQAEMDLVTEAPQVLKVVVEEEVLALSVVMEVFLQILEVLVVQVFR